ncbi:MAG: GxxExxY protein [Anaerolineales bacterium]|nr:GxxExxY protein [Anaerolineales bacterium]
MAGNILLYPELSYRVMEAIFEVHNKLGPGLTEDIYERATIVELIARKIPFEQQKVINILYKGQSIGSYRLDLVIDNKIILELKAVSALNDLHKQQLLAYLKASNLRLGILVNFGTKRVEYVRIAN